MEQYNKQTLESDQSSNKRRMETRSMAKKRVKVQPAKSARIQVSNLFVIMGMNYFKKFDKVLSDIWKTYDRDVY